MQFFIESLPVVRTAWECLGRYLTRLKLLIRDIRRRIVTLPSVQPGRNGLSLIALQHAAEEHQGGLGSAFSAQPALCV